MTNNNDDVFFGDVTKADMIARIEALRADNARLVAKKQRKLNPKPALPVIENPDSKLFAMDIDVANMMVEKGLAPKYDLTAARNMIHLFKLQPSAQCKEPGKAGPGKRLYQLADIQNVINYLLAFPG